jgi:hypothetical protein
LVKKYKKYYKKKMTIGLLEKTITKINDIMETKNVRIGKSTVAFKSIKIRNDLKE